MSTVVLRHYPTCTCSYECTPLRVRIASFVNRACIIYSAASKRARQSMPTVFIYDVYCIFSQYAPTFDDAVFVPSSSMKCAAFHVAARLHVVENRFHRAPTSAILTSSDRQTPRCWPAASSCDNLALYTRRQIDADDDARIKRKHKTPSFAYVNIATRTHARYLHTSTDERARAAEQAAAATDPAGVVGPVCSCCHSGTPY